MNGENAMFIVNKSDNDLPKYATPGSSGMDLRANIVEDNDQHTFKFIKPGETEIIGTGLYVAIGRGYEGQVRTRSGLAAKQSIHVLNSPGTIDSDYRGEIKVILHNSHRNKTFRIDHGDRIAQLVICPIITPNIVPVSEEELSKTKRGEGGFGSTGNR